MKNYWIKKKIISMDRLTMETNSVQKLVDKSANWRKKITSYDQWLIIDEWEKCSSFSSLYLMCNYYTRHFSKMKHVHLRYIVKSQVESHLANQSNLHILLKCGFYWNGNFSWFCPSILTLCYLGVHTNPYCIVIVGSVQQNS